MGFLANAEKSESEASAQWNRVIAEERVAITARVELANEMIRLGLTAFSYHTGGWGGRIAFFVELTARTESMITILGSTFLTTTPMTMILNSITSPIQVQTTSTEGM